MGKKVAILGASKNPDRFSHMAFTMLKDYGHTPLPINPGFSELEGVPVYAKLADVPKPVDTLTMYVGPVISSKMREEILALAPKRVIFNPGSENRDLETALRANGIEVLDACTLVMLRAKQF
ncbi:MAG: CoA-binding protein [Bdellovibrionaceae bacterium]|nr:CoA-binding protein [Pseudobdellovibrionaceae bacterium]